MILFSVTPTLPHANKGSAMHHRLLLFVSSLLLPMTVHAQKWVEVGKTSSGNPVYIDPKTVKKAGTIVNGTIRVRFLTPVKAGAKEFKSSRTLVMADCAKRTVAS